MSNRAATVSHEEAPPSVLVVEDDFLVRAVAVAHLEESGFSILEAQTADEAMVILRDDRSIAAVFSDVQMPGSMDGIALAQWLARACPNVKVLLTSGRRNPDKSVGWRFIAKPYSLEEMERELRNLLASCPES
jgi:CheY-like chemotaxis protein